MCYHCETVGGPLRPIRFGAPDERGRLVADGGRTNEDAEPDGDDDEPPAEAADGTPAEDEPDGGGGPDAPDPGVDESNVEVTDEAEPATPRWEEPDLDDLPEFELGAEGPLTKGFASGGEPSGSADAGGEAADPAAGRPNTARSPEATRISSEGTEAYLVALEVCARLPDDVRLPEEAADLVPAAVEAELERDIQQFAAAEFGTQTPHVDTLSFDEVDGEVWLRLRIGLPPDGFADLDPETVESYALERLEGVL